MAGFYDTLAVRDRQCPSSCAACVDACAQRPNGQGIAVIKRVTPKGKGLASIVTCKQCSKPECVEACSFEAITRSEADGVVRIDLEKCTGCGMCADVCPYEALVFSSEKQKAFKCDRCDGQPRCAEACPEGILCFDRGSRVVKYLGEDRLSPTVSACQGCGAELLVRVTMKIIGPNSVFFTSPSCLPVLFANVGMDKAGQKNSFYYCRMTNIASSMTGIRRYFQRIGKEAHLVAIAGDGSTADVGFQNLSAAAERGENLIYICDDNQGYMNTGIQRSSTTPLGAWTQTTLVGKNARGKSRPSKNVALIMAFHGVPYVATATIADLEDYAMKLTKAMAVKNGLAYIHFLAPCPTGWRAPMESMVELSRMAVETNAFPLWEAEEGKFRINYRPKRVRPVVEWTKLQGRFAHLSPAELDRFQKMVDANLALIEGLTKLEQPVPMA